MSRFNFVPKHKKNLGFEFQGRPSRASMYSTCGVMYTSIFMESFSKELDSMLVFESHLIDLIQRHQT